MKGRTVRVLSSVAISALFLWFAVRDVDWQEAGRALASARYVGVLPMLAVTVWTLYIRAQRWRRLLEPVGRPPMRTLVAATNIGFLANMVLPLRVGEVLRPVLASRREDLPLSGVLATVVLERVFDMFTILFLFGVATLGVPVSAQLRAWGWTFLVLALVVGAVMGLVRWQEERSIAVVAGVARLLPPAAGRRAERFFRGFLQALEVLQSPRAFVRVFLWSLYLWLVIASTYVFGFYTFSLPVPALQGSVTVATVIAIAVSVPSAPGYVGAFQLGCVLALALFGVDESRAMAYSIVVHLSQFVGVVGAGLYSLWSEGMTFREVERVSETSDVAA
ncbi:MAG: membrane protein [Candidatus Binatia bacterium]|nr:MAG: membrane protein [Candidatus Binatia bacterium]